MIFPNIKPISDKRLRQLTKGRAGLENSVWRKKVLERDGNVCQMSKCNNRDHLQVHHIKRWADASHLRTNPANGITLCKKCHNDITGREGHYEVTFFLRAKKNQEKMDAKNNRGHEGTDSADI
jgi:5-methylcytosine-specific restriction endonuclease McrA